MLAGCCNGPDCVQSILKDGSIGITYRVIMIEGCEFYSVDSKLAKIDCNCKADKSKRNGNTAIYEGGPKKYSTPKK